MTFEIHPDAMGPIEEAARARGMSNLEFVTWAIAQAVKTPKEAKTLAIEFTNVPDTLTRLLATHLARRINSHGKA